MIFSVKSVIFALLLILQCQYLFACMLNSDCKQNEQCFKREKNAYGVCVKFIKNKNTYKEDYERPTIQEIEGKQEIIDFFGTPEENLRSISPEGKIGRKCHSTEDCNKTEECVIAGFEGRCLKLK